MTLKASIFRLIVAAAAFSGTAHAQKAEAVDSKVHVSNTLDPIFYGRWSAKSGDFERKCQTELGTDDTDDGAIIINKKGVSMFPMFCSFHRVENRELTWTAIEDCTEEGDGGNSRVTVKYQITADGYRMSFKNGKETVVWNLKQCPEKVTRKVTNPATNQTKAVQFKKLTAMSRTASAITGDILFSYEAIKIEKHTFPIRMVRQGFPIPFEPGSKRTGTLYAVTTTMNPTFSSKNTLCGPKPVHWILFYGGETTMPGSNQKWYDMAAYDSEQMPVNPDDACATFGYAG